jgi:nitroreductase
MHTVIDSTAVSTLFTEARSQNGWTDRPVSDQQLHDLYELMKFCPTSANSQPGPPGVFADLLKPKSGCGQRSHRVMWTRP